MSAGILCYIYAVFDEIHQLFIEGRTATFKDTLLDESGFFLALVLWGIFIFAIERVEELRLGKKQNSVRADEWGC